MSLLPRLPPLSDPGGDLRAAKGLDPAERAMAAARLAAHDLDAIETNRLDRFAANLVAPVPGSTPVRLALLGSHTLDHLAPAIRVGGLRHGLTIATHIGDYGQYRTALLAGEPALDEFAPTHVLLALDLESILPALPMSAGDGEVGDAIAAAVAAIRVWWQRIRARWNSLPIQQTLLPQSPTLVGSNEALLPASPAAMVLRLNAEIRDAAIDDGALLVDVATRMPGERGGDRRYDPVRWYRAKQLINPVFAPLYGELVAQVLAAAAGRARKCLVLDLDNTMWGGVVGDDGIDQLKLGQGSAEGEAFLAFQHYVRRLAARASFSPCAARTIRTSRARCSTRTPKCSLLIRTSPASSPIGATRRGTSARSPHISISASTASSSSTTIPPSARSSAANCPVAVPELPDDVAFYPERIAAAGYFEAAAITRDDFGRGSSYAANRLRDAALDDATDMEGFLRSLEMKLVSGPMVAVDRPRAAQLINKSNQFNLTTIRRGEAELEQVARDPGAIGLCFRLRDRFGDNGLISVIIARRDAALGPTTRC